MQCEEKRTQKLAQQREGSTTFECHMPTTLKLALGAGGEAWGGGAVITKPRGAKKKGPPPKKRKNPRNQARLLWENWDLKRKKSAKPMFKVAQWCTLKGGTASGKRAKKQPRAKKTVKKKEKRVVWSAREGMEKTEGHNEVQKRGHKTTGPGASSKERGGGEEPP